MLTPFVDQNHLQFALDHVPSYVTIKDRNLRYIYANQPTLELFGCTEQHLNGKTDHDFYPSATALRLREIDQRVLAGERRIEEVVAQNTLGRQSIYWVAKTPLYQEAGKNTVTGILSIATDITLQKRLEEQLAYAAEIDILTGLFNRRKLTERLAQAQHRSTRQGTHGCLMRIHVDNFEYLNDTFGHTVGDQLLVAVASRLQQQVRANDTLARYGRAEFILLLEDLAPEPAMAKRQVNTVADKLCSNFQSPLRLHGREVSAGVSLDITLFQGADTSTDSLLSEEAALCAAASPRH